MTTDNGDVCIGAGDCHAANGGNFMTVVGADSGMAFTTGTQGLFLGARVDRTTVWTGLNVALIDTGANGLEPPATNTQNWVNMFNAIRFSLQLPTVNTGFCTAPAMTAGSTEFVTELNVGTACSTGVGTIAFQVAMPNRVACMAQDVTSASSIVLSAVPGGGANANRVTITAYSRTTGAAVNFNSGDVINVFCPSGV